MRDVGTYDTEVSGTFNLMRATFYINEQLPFLWSDSKTCSKDMSQPVKNTMSQGILARSWKRKIVLLPMRRNASKRVHLSDFMFAF